MKLLLSRTKDSEAKRIQFWFTFTQPLNLKLSTTKNEYVLTRKLLFAKSNSGEKKMIVLEMELRNIIYIFFLVKNQMILMIRDLINIIMFFFN